MPRGIYHRPSARERFWKRVRKGPGCWRWTGNRHKGYGTFWLRNKKRRAHHVVLELLAGRALASGVVVRHTCDNPACVRPTHLMIGTHADNVADRCKKGRSASGERQGLSILTRRSVRVIRASYRPYTVTRRSLAEKYHVAQSTIDGVLDRQTWRST